MKQLRLRYLWITATDARPATDARLTIWLCIGGRKPLAHLPRWRRHLLHPPAVRWRLWPKPWNFNGPCYRVGDDVE